MNLEEPNEREEITVLLPGIVMNIISVIRVSQLWLELEYFDSQSLDILTLKYIFLSGYVFCLDDASTTTC